MRSLQPAAAILIAFHFAFACLCGSCLCISTRTPLDTAIPSPHFTAPQAPTATHPQALQSQIPDLHPNPQTPRFTTLENSRQTNWHKNITFPVTSSYSLLHPPCELHLRTRQNSSPSFPSRNSHN